MRHAFTGLLIALALATVGTALIFVGVLSPGVFNAGVLLIELGAAGMAISAAASAFERPEQA